MDAQLTDFREIDPQVLVSPFKAEAVSVNNITLNSSDFFAPGVIILLLQHLLVTFAALSIVRERISGTMELFRVSPVNAFETLLGKYLSYLFIGVVLAAGISALVVLVLRVPMLGSWNNYALVLLAADVYLSGDWFCYFAHFRDHQPGSAVFDAGAAVQHLLQRFLPRPALDVG